MRALRLGLCRNRKLQLFLDTISHKSKRLGLLMFVSSKMTSITRVLACATRSRSPSSKNLKTRKCPQRIVSSRSFPETSQLKTSFQTPSLNSSLLRALRTSANRFSSKLSRPKSVLPLKTAVREEVPRMVESTLTSLPHS